MTKSIVVSLTIGAKEAIEILPELLQCCQNTNPIVEIKTLFVNVPVKLDLNYICHLNIYITQLAREIGFDIRPVYGDSRQRTAPTAIALALKAAAGEIDPDSIDEDLMALSFGEVDLVIVPGQQSERNKRYLAKGEVGFDTAYAEFFFYEGPFTVQVFERAIEDFSERTRNMGAQPGEVAAE